jgi:hypothetical protein
VIRVRRAPAVPWLHVRVRFARNVLV